MSEFTTQRGCTIQVRHTFALVADEVAMSLTMRSARDGRRVEVVLTDAERAQLRALLE